MSDPDLQCRFEELDAARALGNLSPEEHEELANLLEKENFETDADLDWIVAALEVGKAESSKPLDAGLKEKLLSDAKEFNSEPRPSKVVPIWKHPAIGWAVAACIALAFILLKNPDAGSDDAPLTLAEAKEILMKDPATVQLPFSGTPDFADLEGDVVWGDKQQQGYMTLSGLPANDPSKSQYQLWIVDPERDSAPVDGGVFDIETAGGSTIVKIDAALAVLDPKAFVITVEQPGGVVVSKQEIVAAIAKPS